MKALDEVGFRRLARYGGWSAFAATVRAAPTPILRAALLRLGGAVIGADTVIQPGLRLENLDRNRGPAALSIGRACWLGPDIYIDLAQDVAIGDDVSIGTKTVIATHLNVGYESHPLQRHMPKHERPVVIGDGSFVAVGVILLPGTRLGPQTFVAAGAVVSGEHPGYELLAGAPAKARRRWDQDASGTLHH